MNEHLRVAIDHLHEGVQVISFDWRYLYLNQTAAQHGQRDAGDLIGQRMHDCYPGIEHTDVFAVLERVMASRRAERFQNEFEFPSGERRWFDLRIEPVPAGICVLSMDVTADRQREDRLRAVEVQLQQAQKMEALGRLAGGIAHDFNNQLTVILGFAQMLLESAASAEVRRDLQEIEAAAQRSAALIRQLLAFGKRQVLRTEPVYLPDLVRDVARLLDRVLGEHVACRLHLDPDTALVLADSAQLEHVLTNLALNARDAMPSGGELTIATCTVALDASDDRLHAAMPPGRYTLLSVKDTGIGMDDDTKARLFEPFFTTKAVGKGTGLGLSMVYGAVKQMNGFIWVDSEPGRGSTFRVYFPVTEQQRTAPAKSITERAPASNGHAILVVEDDRSVRELVVRSLEQHGYRVTAADSAEAARQCLRQPGAAFDLLLLDVVLPEGSGPALFHEFAHINPRVVFMSGYSPQHVQDRQLTKAAPLLEKPFSAEQLLQVVRHALAPTGTKADFADSTGHKG